MSTGSGPSRGGAIHLADLAQALDVLHPRSEAHAEAIARALGFAFAPAKAPEHPDEVYDPRKNVAAPESQPTPVRSPGLPSPPPLPTPLPSITRESSLQRSGGGEGRPADQRPEPRPDPEAGARPRARRPIFPRRTYRHLLSPLLSSTREGRDPDIPRLVDALARRTPLRDLPREWETRMPEGCQLLQDFASSMRPWWEDLPGLEAQLHTLLGVVGVTTYTFTGDPEQARHWNRQLKASPWVADGRPVLVATDFGIRGRSGRARAAGRWRWFVRECRRTASPLVFLVPWPERRWPRDLGAYPLFVHWSAATTAAMVNRVLDQRRWRAGA